MKKLLSIFCPVFVLLISIAIMIVSFFSGRIPYLNQLVTRDYQTNTNFKNWTKRSDMKMAKFSVDFLVHLEDRNSKFIAIYPYTISAGFNFMDIKSSESKIIFPKIEIYESESQAANIIRSGRNDAKGNGIFSNNDEDKMLTPVKIALSKKARDYAYEYNIVDRAKESTRKFFSRFYPNGDVQFEFEKDKEETVSIPSTYMNVKFIVADKTFERIVPEILCRDDSIFRIISKDGNNTDDGIKIGLNHWIRTKSYDGTLNEISRKSVKWMLDAYKDNPVAFFYRDPYRPNEKFLIANASNGYIDAAVYMKDGGSFFLTAEDGNVSGTKLQEDIAPNLLYLAMSAVEGYAEKSDKSGNYSDFSQAYDNACFKLNKVLGEKADDISLVYDTSIVYDIENMKKAYGEESQYCQDVIEMDALNNVIRTRRVIPTGSESFDQGIQVLSELAKKSRDSQYLERVLNQYKSNNNLRCRLEQYYMTLAENGSCDFTRGQVEKWTDDLLGFDYLTREIIRACTQKTLRHLVRSMNSRAGESDKCIEKMDLNDCFVFFGKTYEDFIEGKQKGFGTIRNQIKQNASSKKSNVEYTENFSGDNFYVIYEYKGLGNIFTHYGLLDLRHDGLYFFDEFTEGWPGSNKAPVFIPYKNIEIAGSVIRFNTPDSVAGFLDQSEVLRNILSRLREIYIQNSKSTRIAFETALAEELIGRKYLDMTRPYYGYVQN